MDYEYVKLIPKSTKVQIAATLHDAIAAALAFSCAFLLRLGEDAIPIFTSSKFWLQCVYFVFLATVVSRSIGVNRSLWRYASVPEMIAIVKTGLLTTLFFAVSMFMVDRLDSIPRTAVIISCVLLIFFFSSSRFCYRLFRDRRERRLGRREMCESVLVVGSGDGADLFIRAANERREMRYDILGVFDETGRRAGLKLRGIKIISGDKALKKLIERHQASDKQISSFVLSKRMAEFPTELIDQLIDLSAEYGIGLKQLPSFQTPDPMTSSHMELQPIKIDDLLARAEVSLDSDGLEEMLSNATIAVTGAGGSIGSQLCRELLAFEPRKLILLDLSEYNVYNIDREMRQAVGNKATEIASLIFDVRQRDNVKKLFCELKPEIVFHAAALKHVPIVESQPLEGLQTNILGSRNVCDAAKLCRAKAVVLISTDKAVNPTNIMGATKRAAEIYCQISDLDSDTRCVIVRFGNVLGSAGSVVPHFQKQIAAGGPVTVTHRDITRYFMTIPEACQLVIKAAHLGLKNDENRGSVHVLDMGEPVKIEALAKKMITLSGLRPGTDIKIIYTGLRPGEKLYEELFKSDEKLIGSTVKEIFVATPPVVSRKQMFDFLSDVENTIHSHDAARAVSLLSTLIPELKLANSIYLGSAKTSSVAVIDLEKKRGN